MDWESMYGVDMQIEELENKFQVALRKRFPGVIVREDKSTPEEDIFPFLDVFMIPDDRSREFFHFMLDEYSEFIKRENLPDCDLTRHSDSVTREFYPRIFAEAQKELAAQTRSAKSKPRAAAARARKTTKPKS